jgi:hypothetical protein
MAGLYQQPQYSPFGALNPQQYFNNPYQQQQYYYPQQQQQQQFYYPQQQQQQQFCYPQQQQQLYYPQLQQQQQFPFYPQQQGLNWPVSFLGQNAYGNQQYWPQQQRVYEDAPTPLPPMRHKKGKSNKH